MQRYLEQATGGERTYSELTDQFPAGYLSARLQEWVAYYAGRMSYQEVERLLVRLTGEKLLSGQKIQHLVVAKAAAVSRAKQASMAPLKAAPMPAVSPVVDFYAAGSKEVVLMEDGIQVKQQKTTRKRPYKRASQSKPPVQPKQGRRRVVTDVAMLQQSEGRYAYLCGGIDERGEGLFDVVEALRAALVTHYGQRKKPLQLVAITDGAQHIRTHLEQVFGRPIPVILDWYHLCKRVRELVSMLSRNKQERAQHLETLLPLLWRGKTGAALAYLRTEVQARQQKKLAELVAYLEKHCHEIIDYERRQKAGKVIGSGRMEKGVDQAIGYRQKKKGMSWSQRGSKALGILKVVELNREWDQLWFGRAVA